MAIEWSHASTKICFASTFGIWKSLGAMPVCVSACACMVLVIQLNTHQVIYYCECAHIEISWEREIWRAKVMCKRNSATTTATPLVNFVISPEIPNHNEWMYRFCVSRTTLCIYASLNACAIFCGVKKRKIDFIWNVRIFCTLAVSLLGFVGFSGWAWYLLPSNQYHTTSNFPTITMPTYSCLWAEYYNVSTVAMALDSTLFVVNSQTNSEHVTLMRQKRAHVYIFMAIRRLSTHTD